MKESIFEKVKRAFKEVSEESKFYNARKPIIEHIGPKQNIDTCTCTLHLKKDGQDIIITFDLFYSEGGIIFKSVDNKLSYSLFDGCLMAGYIEDALNKDSRFDVGFSFEDLQQSYNELNLQIIDELPFIDIWKQSSSDYDEIRISDRVFYTKMEYLMRGVVIKEIGVGKIKNIPENEYNNIYPCKVTTLKPALK